MRHPTMSCWGPVLKCHSRLVSPKSCYSTDLGLASKRCDFDFYFFLLLLPTTINHASHGSLKCERLHTVALGEVGVI